MRGMSQYKCPACGGTAWRIFYSKHMMECDDCRKQYHIDEIMGKITIKHQRG
jgi:hypothetical protein